MKQYKLIGKIVLGFIVDDVQQDLLLGPGDGIVEWDEKNTVFFITPIGKRYESQTTANIIETGLRKKSLEEIKP